MKSPDTACGFKDTQNSTSNPVSIGPVCVSRIYPSTPAISVGPGVSSLSFASLKADATLVDIGFAHERMVKSGEGLAIVGPQVRLDAGTGIGVRESDGALKDKLNRAVDAMKQDGSLNALIEKWFGPDAETF